jgi:hypothetical protein
MGSVGPVDAQIGAVVVGICAGVMVVGVVDVGTAR